MGVVVDLIKEYLLITKLEVEGGKVPERWKKGEKGDVVLLPGLGCRWNTLKYIGDSLNKDGFRVHTIPDLGKNRDPVETQVKKVEEYLRKNNLKKTIVIAHSKGGLIGKYLLDYSPEGKRVRKLIAIATPFHGSKWAGLKILRAEELEMKSELIHKLREKSNVDKIVSIYPKLDNHVIPGVSSILEGAKNVQINIVGHTRILESPGTVEVIRQVLS